MAGGAPLPVREYASGEEMYQRYAAIQRATFAPRQTRVMVEPEPEPVASVRERFLARSRAEKIANLKILQATRIVAAVTGVSIDEIKGPKTHDPIVKARHIAMYLACRTGRTFCAIGYYLGERDRTTVINAKQRVYPIYMRCGLRFCEDPVEIAHQLWNADWRLADGAAR